MRPLHTYAFRKLADFPTAENKLLLQIRSLESLSSFAKRHREKILLDERLVRRRVKVQLGLHFLKRDLFICSQD